MIFGLGTMFYDGDMAFRHSRVLNGVTGVVLNLTNRCNLRCMHCFDGSGQYNNSLEELHDGEMISIIEELCEIKPYNVCFSGGEPFLRKKLLFEGLGILARAGIRTSIVTNGCLIGEDDAVKLKELGVAEIEVSLDGACSETHDRLRGVNGAFEKALRGMGNLIAADIRTSISFTLTRFNSGEISDLFRKVYKLGIRCMFIRPMLIMGTAVKNSGSLAPAIEHYREAARAVYALQKEGMRDKILLTDALNHLLMLRGQSCVPYVEIKADGLLIPSPYIQYSFGNIRRYSLKTYWEAGLYRIWQIPEIYRILDNINSIKDLPEALSRVPAIGEGELSHFDLIDDAEVLWENDAV